MFDPNAYDVEPRRKFGAADAGHLVFTFINIVCSGLLFFRDVQCNDYKFWNQFLFFGCLIWLTYLVITLVTQFKNKGIRVFLSYLDYLYLIFHVALQVWANYLYYKYEEENLCVKRWNFWLSIYILFGYVGFTCLLSVIFMWVLRKMNSKKFRPVEQHFVMDQDFGHGNLNKEE